MHIIYPWVQKEKSFYFVIPFYCRPSNIGQAVFIEKERCDEQIIDLLSVNESCRRFIMELEWSLVITHGEEVFIKKSDEIDCNFNNEDILLTYGRFNRIQEYKYREFTIATHDDYRYRNLDNLIDKIINRNEIEDIFYNLEVYRLLDLKTEII